MPDGSRPTAILASTARVAGSIRDTVPSRLFATQIASSPAAIGPGPLPSGIVSRHRAGAGGRDPAAPCCRCCRRPRRRRRRPRSRSGRCRRRRALATRRRPGSILKTAASLRARHPQRAVSERRRAGRCRRGGLTLVVGNRTDLGNRPELGVQAHGPAAPAVGDPGGARPAASAFDARRPGAIVATTRRSAPCRSATPCRPRRWRPRPSARRPRAPPAGRRPARPRRPGRCSGSITATESGSTATLAARRVQAPRRR